MARFTAFTTALTLLMTLSMPAFAANTVITEIAVYLNGDFYGHSSMLVDGSIYTANGDVSFNNSGGNTVNGNIIMNENAAFIIDGNGKKPDISGEVLKKADTEFNYTKIDLIDYPDINNKVESFTAGYWPLPEDISENTHFKRLEIKNYLNIDTSIGDIYLVADSFFMNGNAKLNIIGDNNVYLFIKNEFSISGSCEINTDRDCSRMSIFTGEAVEIGGNSSINANIYCTGQRLEVNGSGTLYGNIISNAENFEMVGNGEVHGTVFVPYAKAVVRSSACIYGRLIADSLEMYGNGSIYYEESLFDVPSEVKKYTLIITKNINEAGEVTPSKAVLGYGERTQVSARANSGYVFSEYINSDNGFHIPDKDGVIAITRDTHLVAVFYKEEAEELPEISVPADELISSNEPETENKLNKLSNDYAYVYGHTDTIMAPENPVTRSEATAMLHRLVKQNDLLDGYKKPSKPSYYDLSKSDWYFTAIEYMRHIGVYNTGNFPVLPYEKITRGEAAKIFAFALGLKSVDSDFGFDDMDSSNKFFKYLNTLVHYGYIYGDDGANTIRPDDVITRAEFVAVYNRIIGRDDSFDVEKDIDGNDVVCKFVDLKKSDWYYKDMMRASNSFTDKKIDNSKRLDRSELDEY